MAKKQKPVKLNQQQRTAAEIKGLRERNANLVQQAIQLQSKMRYYNERRDTEEKGWKVVADNSVDGTRCHAAIKNRLGELAVMSEVVTSENKHEVAVSYVKPEDFGFVRPGAVATAAAATFIFTAGVACIIVALL